ECVGANDGTGMNVDAMDDAHEVIKGHPRMNAAVLANPTARPDDRVSAYLCFSAHVRLLSDHRVWPDAGASGNPRQRGDDRGRMNSRGDRSAIEIGRAHV